MTRENLDGEVSGVAAMGFEWIQKPLGWRERYWKLLELRMRAAWRSMTWTIGFLMGTRNLADWWQVLIGLERTSQRQVVASAIEPRLRSSVVLSTKASQQVP